jgi:signal transduction histidine kinase
MHLTLRLKLISFTFCVVLTVGGTIALSSIYQGRQRILTTFQRECQDIAAMIAEAITNEVYSLNLYALRYRLENTRVNPDISDTYVTDQDGVVLADGTQANPLRDQPLSDPFRTELLRADAWISRVEGGMLRIGGPIRMPDGSRIGSLQVGFSLTRASRIVHETTRASLYVTGLCLGIGAFLAFVFAIHFSRPIASMARAASAIGAGKLDTRVRLMRGDELGLLAASINAMAANLEQSEAALQRKVAETRTLYQLGQEITAQVALEPTLQLIVKRARELLQAERCVLALRQGTSDTFAFQAYSGALPEGVTGVRFRPGEGLSGRVAMTAMPLVVNDYLQEYLDSPFLEAVKAVGVRSAVAVPLHARGTVMGVLMVSSRSPHRFRPEDQQLLSTLAVQAAIAIENAMLYEQERGLRHTLEELNRQIQGANQRKTEFVTLVSHELRTPLASMMGYTELLLAGGGGPLTQRQREWLGIIGQNADRLETLIDDLLDTARIEMGKIELKHTPLDLIPLIQEVARALRPQIARKGQRLTLELAEALPAIVGDADRLRQILTNLLSNALKYTPSGGHITIAAHEDTDCVRVAVQDTGIGLTPAEQAQLFTPFFRAQHATTPRVGGTGLGLAITRALVELHGGTITVTSVPGQGSTFSVTLPTRQAPEDTAVGPTPSADA